MQLHFIRPYESIEPKATINLDQKGVSSAVLKVVANEPYQLNLKINTNLNSDLYKLLESQDAGLRLQADDIDLVFIKKSGFVESTENLTGEKEIKFVSEDILLSDIRQNPRILPYNSVYSGTISNFIKQLSKNFFWTFVGNDRNFTLSTGMKDNYQLLQELINSTKNISFRNNGVKTIGGISKTEILVGNFKVLPIKHFATNFSKTPFEKNIIQIKDLTIAESGEVLSHILPIGDVGLGADNSSFVYLDDPSADFIDGDFPLVPSSSKLSNGKTIYEIWNKNSNLKFERGAIYPIFLNQNTENLFITFTKKDAQKKLYETGVRFLKNKTDNSRYRIEIDYHHIILPLDKIQVNFSQTIESLNGKREISTQKVLFVQDREFDLSNF